MKYVDGPSLAWYIFLIFGGFVPSTSKRATWKSMFTSDSVLELTSEHFLVLQPPGRFDICLRTEWFLFLFYAQKSTNQKFVKQRTVFLVYEE